ncbi:MAG TPA: adenine phosphoribosyltransferase [Micavibrio sp.]
MTDVLNIKDHIRAVPDFPKPGILFYDISTLIAHPTAWRQTLSHLETQIAAHKPDLLMGIESRGFLPTAPLADRMGLGFAMARKKGKLPGQTIHHNYDLEYGTDTLEIQPDLIKPGTRIVVLDDLLATGGTLRATIDLARKAGAEVVAAACIIELDFLKGREKIDVPFISLVQYQG